MPLHLFPARPEKSLFVWLFLLIFSLLQGCADNSGEISSNEDLKLVETFEGGSYWLSPKEIYPVLNLQGSWHAMGRQYGYLLRNELRNFHDAISADVAKRGMDYSEQVKIAREFASLYSPEINHIMKGISETSGMNEDEVMVLNAGMILLTIQILSGAPPSACSGVAAWNEYTPDGTLVFGRNWDIDRESMLDYMEFLGIVVFHPTDGLAVANIHPIGNLYLETGMNERGIFLELNNGEQSDSNFNEEAEDTSSVLLRVLSSCSSMNDAVEMLCAEPADVSYIIQVADSSSAVSVERATFGYRVREGKEDGLLAAYNSFVPPFPPEWQGLINPPPSAMQDPRLENLRNLANSPEFKGHLNAEKMMDLMDVRMEDGGAVHDGTVVQVIAIPETRTVWFRGLEYSDWEKVELDELFNMK